MGRRVSGRRHWAHWHRTDAIEESSLCWFVCCCVWQSGSNFFISYYLLFFRCNWIRKLYILSSLCRLNINNNNNNNKIAVVGDPGFCIRFCRAQGAHNIFVAFRAFDPLSEIGRISVNGIGCYGRNPKEYSSLVSKSAELRCPLLERGIRQGKYFSIRSFFNLAL